MYCNGTSNDHCCYVDGVPCPFLEENTLPGRRWVCGLMRKLGSWAKVHTDNGYRKKVQPMWDRIAPGYGCGDWPLPGITCESCGLRNG